ncbi:chaplin family protein [Actinomadura sp. HBU206391]|uniref:chaplin family protein n=1 Tax=Actinomadura sp. HBU206391 TaxID=2731692 RepID=UPI00164FC7F7|nr:chaplin family protein [Actinomadura sp. HBU206391]MBC6458474.1 DUF320 domain-containing protein [Actinomadura sp. HBU206391]
MRTWTKGTTRAALFTASFVAVGAGAISSPLGASADTTSGDYSVLGGNQINAPVSLPINVSGNSVAVVGDAVSHSKGGASVIDSGPRGGSRGQRTSGHESVGGGNQINAPVKAPINVCGNAVAVVGEALANCKGGAKVADGRGQGNGGQRTSGRRSILGGNQVFAPISLPVNVCGNAIAILGGALAGCEGGAKVADGGDQGRDGGQRTSGRGSILGGNQVFAPISVPVNVCGNAVGNAVAGCRGGASVKTPRPRRGAADSTSGWHSVGGGNQIHLPIKAPVNVCGNAAAVLGDAIAGCAGGAGGHAGHGGYEHGGGYGHGHGYRTSHGPVHSAAVTRTLPTLPNQTRALPLSPGAALPTLPELPTQVPAGAPATYSAAQSTLPIDDPTVPPNLPVRPPALPDLPVMAPDGLSRLPVQTEQLTTALPSSGTRRAAVAKDDTIPGLLPAKPKLPVRPPVVPGDARSKALPIPAGDLPELPAVDKVDAPRVGGVHDQLGTARKPVTGLVPMAASDLLTGGVTGGSAYVLVVGALLAAAAAVMSLTRRVRLGRR